MKITAEFNSQEELLSFISTFSSMTLKPIEKEVQAEIVIDKEETIKEELREVTVQESKVEEDTKPTEIQDVKVEEQKTEEIKVTKEMVRAIFTKLIKAGKGKEAKELTEKYGASKLPELKEEFYLAVYKEAEVLL